MKKLLIGLVCSICCISAARASYLYVSSCGEVAITVDPSFFESEEEAQAFYAELDEILCSEVHKVE
ncbi:MAG: hypothetical protein ACI4BH_04405 [Muribaculaceae bacterium]